MPRFCERLYVMQRARVIPASPVGGLSSVACALPAARRDIPHPLPLADPRPCQVDPGQLHSSPYLGFADLDGDGAVSLPEFMTKCGVCLWVYVCVCVCL
jgi:hypothetical protein